MAELGAEQAAQRLHARSHRMAAEEEIAAHLEKENQARRQSFHEGLRRKGIAVVEVSETPSASSKPATTRRR
jgi:DNA-binding LacI/PurR family transcriptional regulator